MANSRILTMFNHMGDQHCALLRRPVGSKMGITPRPPGNGPKIGKVKENEWEVQNNSQEVGLTKQPPLK